MRQFRGFTLIELLVVIAIIGLLASIVLVSLNAARLKAKDTRIIADANQLRTIMEAQYASTADYNAIKAGGSWNSCSVPSNATGFATQANQVCNDIIATETACPLFGGWLSQCIYFFNTQNDTSSRYSIIAYLPGASASAGANMYYCVGSSGQNSVSDGVGTGWVSPGCWANP
jgi:prepilin-type N-terminal cleavage/methylation domain-containing protein